MSDEKASSNAENDVLVAIVRAAVLAGASDIHLSVGRAPSIRTIGALALLPGAAALSADDLAQFCHRLAGDRWTSFDGDLDCRAFVAGTLLRVNIFREIRGLGCVLRIITAQPPQLDSLGLPAAVGKFGDMRSGLVLVCGVTGSGKSTTLAALINKINEEKPVHIITIEDPIEFVHTSKKAVVHQREVSHGGFGHTSSFSHALRSALREDPDVILVGEMRDAETIESALTAAETGHLVFGTLHAGAADQAIDRVIDALPADRQNQARAQLAATLGGVIVQSLVPGANGTSRVVVSEIMVVTHAIRAMIREGKTHQLRSALQTGGSEGSVTFDASLAKAIVDRKISPEDGATWCRDETELRDWILRFRKL